MPTSKEIGERLVKLRGNRTRNEVAEGMRINRTTLCNYEAGLRIPRDETKKVIADYYGTTIQQIFFD